jgi:transcriptional regulator with XRE-family HTH domain
MAKRRRIYPDLQSYLDDFTAAGGLQSEFAARMGMSEGYLSDIKQRRVRPGFKLAKRLADECNIPLESFLYEPIGRAS